ncbi:protein ripply1 [Ctenodactylus gundi]
MDSTFPVPTSSLAPALAPAPAPHALPGLFYLPPLVSSGYEVPGSGRLFWPKSHSFDYLYSAGEVLLQNFPVQATINLYEDSNSEEEQEEYEEEGTEEANEKKPEECVRPRFLVES